MTQALAPSAPFRVDLATALRAEGRHEEADGVYPCRCGRPDIPAAHFIDVRDQGEAFPTPFVCDTCASELQRHEQAAYEQALRDYLAAQGTLDEETLNGLRAERDKLLRATDHTQLADYREDMGEAAYQLVTAYRAALRAWFVTARDTGEIGDLPEPPSDPSTTPETETVQ